MPSKFETLFAGAPLAQLLALHGREGTYVPAGPQASEITGVKFLFDGEISRSEIRDGQASEVKTAKLKCSAAIVPYCSKDGRAVVDSLNWIVTSKPLKQAGFWIMDAECILPERQGVNRA